MKCMLKKCKNNATKTLEIVAYADKDHPPAVGHMGVYICNDCSEKEEPNDLIDREQFEAQFIKLKLKIPDWNLSYAHWIDIV